MDKIESYINSLALQISGGRSQIVDEIKDRLYTCVLDVVIDNLSLEQMESLKGRMSDTRYVSEKIEEFAKEIPALASQIEEKLASEAKKIKKDLLLTRLPETG